MTDTVITFDRLSKSYQIGSKQRHGKTFREALTDTLLSPLRRLKSIACGGNGDGAAGEETFWALKDVSFEVKRGEVVGIIGPNGAGKSTLLKILSQITEPTSGTVRMRGRVASLLEVGTGFHPELTGRENIYLNGAILGMKRAEITRKFDEIVAFAEVEKFLDTPVKRYSSGMYVRLAFAVAAHLEPEILVVDEVLAVGDAEFQKKCLGKMQEVSKGERRTVLFVSHNMEAIVALCTKAVMLREGAIKFEGDVHGAIEQYRDRMMGVPLNPSRRALSRKITAVKSRNQTGTSVVIRKGSPIEFIVEIQINRPQREVLVGVNINTNNGKRVATLWSGFCRGGFSLTAGQHRFVCCVEHVDLVPGEYSIEATLGDRQEGFDLVESALNITVVSQMSETSVRKPNGEHGSWCPTYHWRAEEESA